MEKLVEKLFNETDGSVFSNLKDKLIKKYAELEGEQVIFVLMQYVREGKLLHWRNFLLTDIIKLIKENETQYSNFWKWAIEDNELCYWSIDGLIKTDGKNAYSTIIDIITSNKYSTKVRAKAIKSISKLSKQTFDRGLSTDPGYWKAEDLRIGEVLEWQKNKYPDGKGYSEPQIHQSLNAPKTDLEKIVAKLEKKLKVKRAKYQDLCNPTNWLAIADEEDMLKIEQKWKFPKEYFTFLKKYSPINVSINNKNFPQGINLYGASVLLERQIGYSYNPVKQEIIADFPENLVVIADSSADPYCIDINSKNGTIYTSMHGVGKWEFEVYADNFTDFLKELS